MEKFIRKYSRFCPTFKISKGRTNITKPSVDGWIKESEGKRLLSERLLREVCELSYNDIISLQKRVGEITLSLTQMNLSKARKTFKDEQNL